ncbi:helix-turn-helix transcriptional regulator [Aeromicrobium panaciterrae]|uniref:helix-turn-helix transcriptional regulator n=1 Tax=Aeromicrobium panaciterrae TaxID=363861 RepID=UPI0031D8B13E
MAKRPALVDLESYLGGLPGGDCSNEQRAIAHQLDMLRSDRSIVVTIDDASRLDSVSLELIPALFGAVGGSVHVIAATEIDTTWDREWAICLDRLGRRASIVTTRIAPMSPTAVREHVRARFGRTLETDEAAVLTTYVGGNPWLLDHVLSACPDHDEPLISRLKSRRALFTPAAADHTVRHLVGPNDTHAAVAAAVAFIGTATTTRLGLVSELVNLREDDLAEILDELTCRQILSPAPWTVTSSALARALDEACGAGRRALWHTISARWLSALPSSDQATCELAAHLIHTAEPGDEAATRSLLSAADILSSTSPGDSATYYAAASALLGPADPQRGSVQLRLARALLFDGRVKEAQDVAAAVMPTLVEDTDRARAMHIVNEASGTLGESGVDQSVQACSTSSPSGHIPALRAHLSARAGDLPAAQVAIGEVRKSLRGEPARGRIIPAIHLAHAQGLVAGYDDMIDTIDAIVAALPDEPVPTQIAALTNVAFLLGMQGDVRTAEHIAAAHDLLDGSGLGLMRIELETANIVHEFHTGQWDSALTRIERLRPQVTEAGSINGLVLAQSIECGIQVHRGQWAKARGVELDLHDDAGARALAAWNQSAIDLQSGEAETALKVLEAALRAPAPPRFRHLLAVRAGEAELVLGRPAQAAACARLVLDDRPGARHVSLTHLDAQRLLALAIGDVDLATAAREASLGRDAAFLQATTTFALGTLRPDGENLLREAYERFHALGADPSRRKCATELRRRGQKVPRHREPRPTTLTDVELQVGRLVQLGRQNREIAVSMSLSVKTVEAYLTRIYAKTGCASRLELARQLDEHPPTT